MNSSSLYPLHDVALLVHLDRIDRGVGAAVAELLDRVAELGGEGLNAGPEDIGKTEQERQAHALGVEIHGQVVEVEPALPVGVGVDHHMPLGVDPKVPQTPPAHVVELFGVLGGPVRRGGGYCDGATPDGGAKGQL